MIKKFSTIVLIAVFSLFICLFGLTAVSPSPETARADNTFVIKDSFYAIETKEDLLLLANKVNNGEFDTDGVLFAAKTYAMHADIDMTGTNFPGIGNGSDMPVFIPLSTLNSTTNALETLFDNWDTYGELIYETSAASAPLAAKPAYSSDLSSYYIKAEIPRAFFGTFHGNSRSITGLNAPLFGALEHAEIASLAIKDSNITLTNENGGALAKNVRSSRIENIIVNNSRVTVKGNGSAGSLLGEYGEAITRTIKDYPYSNVLFESVIGIEMDALYQKTYFVNSYENVINCENGYAGGIIGANNAPLNQALSKNEVNGADGKVGGTVGYQNSAASLILSAPNNACSAVFGVLNGNVSNIVYDNLTYSDANVPSSYDLTSILLKDYNTEFCKTFSGWKYYDPKDYKHGEESYTFYYPTPFAFNYEQVPVEVKGVSVDSGLKAIFINTNAKFTLPESVDEGGRTFMYYTQEYTQKYFNDFTRDYYYDGEYKPLEEITVNSNMFFVSVYSLDKPSVSLDKYEISSTYNGVAATVTASYTHEYKWITASYAWYYSADGSNFNPIDVSAETLSVKDVADSGYYKCKITVTLESPRLYEKDYLEAYEYSNVLTVSVLPAALTYDVVLESSTTVFTGSPVSIYADVNLKEGTYYETAPLDFTYSGTDNVINVGEYAIDGAATNENYSISVNSATFTVTPATVTDIVATPYEGVYDGTPHNIEVTCKTVAETPYNVEYSLVSGVFDTVYEGITDSTDETITVYYKISAANHTDAYGTSTVKIDKNTLSIAESAEYALLSKVYDDTVSFDVAKIDLNCFAFTYASDYSLATPVALSSCAFSSNQATDNGVNDHYINVVFTLTDSQNFILTNTEVRLHNVRIEKATIELARKDGSVLTKIYDGNTDFNQSNALNFADYFSCSVNSTQKPVVSISEAIGNSYRVSACTNVKISVYASNNYVFKDGVCEMTFPASITPKSVSINETSITMKNREYDGTSIVKVLSADLVGVVGVDEVNISFGDAFVNSPDASETPYIVQITDYSIDNDDYVLLAQTLFASVTISKATPTVNPVLDKNVLYVLTEKPTIALASADTPGEIYWDDGAAENYGENALVWIFIPQDETNYRSISGSVTVTYKQNVPVELVIDSMPEQTEYYAFDSFNVSGLSVSLLYADGTSVVLQKDTDFSYGYFLVYEDNASCFVYGHEYVTITVTDNENSLNFTKNIPVTVKKITLSEPTLYGEYVYDGALKTLILSGFDSDKMTVDNNAHTDAGEYVSNVKLKDANNYAWGSSVETVRISWTIRPAVKKALRLAKTEYVYCGEPVSPDIVNDNIATDFFTYSGTTSATNSGEYTFTATLINGNYVWENSTSAATHFTWRIVPQKISKPVLYNEPYTYNGVSQKVTSTVDVENVTAYELSGDIYFTNAGSYKIVATLKHVDSIINYVWEDGAYAPMELTYTVNRIIVQIPTITASYSYSGNAYSLSISSNESYTVSGVTSAIAAGNYSATLTLKDEVNYVWDNGETAPKTYDWDIRKAVVDIPESAGVRYYNGKEQTALIPPSNYYSLSGNTAVNVGVYTATATLNNVNYQWKTGSSEPIKLTWKIEKLRVEKPSAPGNLIYNGLTQSAHLSANDHYTVTGNVVKDVGNYVAVIVLKDKVNTCWNDGSGDDLSIPYSVFGIYVSADDGANLSADITLNAPLSEPYKEGFVFEGWYLTKDLSGNPVTSIKEEMLTENIVLYPKWREAEPENPSDQTHTKTNSGLSVKAIVGISVGCGCILIALLIIILGLSIKKRKRR